MFQRGDWALLYDSWFKDFKGKIYSRWMGPYEVDTVFDNGIIRLITSDEAHIALIMKGHRLKLYHCPTSRDSFIKYLSDNWF